MTREPSVPPMAPGPPGRAAEACLRPASELSFLLDIAAAARTRPQPEVFTRACRELAELLDVRASAFVRTRGGDKLKLAVSRGTASPGAGRVGDAAELLNDVVETRTPVQRLIPAQRDAPDPADRAHAADAEPGPDAPSAPAFAVPLGLGGVLLVDGPKAEHLTRDQRRLVEEVGALLGRLVDEARVTGLRENQLQTARAVRTLLEAGVRAVSRLEAAEALARTTATVLGVSTACAYLVDDDGRVAEVATVGAGPGRDALLRKTLVGAPADGSPVWRRAATGDNPGADLVTDTRRPGAVRAGGVAEILGLRSIATIPLLSSAGILGIVTCGDADAPREWLPHDRELLEQLALQGTVVVDNARLREAERHEARADELTGLANRRAFSDALDAVLIDAAVPGQRVAILQIDLDRFKEVNDQYGHHEGDALLIEVARRLSAVVRDVDLVARLGGDEFAVLLVDDVDPANAEAVATRIADALEQPIELVDHEVTIEASVGIALYPEHGHDPETLLQRADRAMYAAKRSGLGQLVYRSEHDASTQVEPGMLGELRRAVAEDELVLHYQPKVDLRSGRVVGVEALVRWLHPRLGLLAPDRFVPLAEQTSRVRSVTNWVVPQALAQARRWRETGLDLTVAVNVSAHDVADPGFPALVAQWLRDADLPGDRLVVEVTEGTLMADRVAASAVLSGLREIGVTVSLDDFGTGYSSLAYLHSLPVDEIKIDRSFLGEGARRYTVIRSMIALGQGLGLRTVTEGVEDVDTASMLSAFGSDLAQGYYFARPMPADAVEHLLRTGRTVSR